VRIGSLFSGIGGLELGLEWAGLGPTIWQVERDPFCRAVLEKHWPEAKRFDDVRTFGSEDGATVAPVDLICGGFPCQDVSSAGKGAGLAGERSGLWREFARIVALVRPRFVVVENVASGAARWLDAVVRDMEELRYACLPVPLSAADVGALHLRKRIFVVASYADCQRQLQSEGLEQGERRRAANGFTPDPDRQPGGARSRGPRSRGNGRSVSDGDTASNDDNPRRERSGPGAQNERRAGPSTGAWGSPQSGVVPLVHGLSGGLAGRGRRARIRALGNSVVPQCAEVIGWIVRELDVERVRAERGDG
jgi:DNA (cytosine-5)-methyltransferase 1